MFPLAFLEKVRVEIKTQQASPKFSPAAQVFPLYEGRSPRLLLGCSIAFTSFFRCRP